MIEKKGLIDRLAQATIDDDEGASAEISREIIDAGIEAKILIEQWRREYTYFRFHSVLGYRSPAPAAKLSLTLT